ncbi:putative protein-like [Raphanus sativus]|nr:putative protein-like [Raphanus sativus]
MRPVVDVVCCNVLYREAMKGNQRQVSNERRRQSLRIRKPPVSNAKKRVAQKKNKKKSTPVREPSIHSLSVSSGSESEDMSAPSFEEMQPMQPLEFYFKSSEFAQTCKIQTKCFVTKTVEKIKKKLKPEAEWFRSHPQFRHFFHMPDEPNLKLQGMWMLLLRTICTPEDDVAWFAVNGVPIRYSMREHALISGLDCREYPRNYEKLGSHKFVDYYFHDVTKITISDVEQKMLSMALCPDRLKMTVLYFLGRVIRGKPNDTRPLDSFILRIVEDLEACISFPWGRLTFEDAIKEIKHVMNHLKGEVNETCGFPGFIIPLEVLAFECIPALGKKFRITPENPSEDCPRMCKSRFIKTSLRGYPLEDIYDALGETKDINSVLVPTLGEEIMLARIIDEERDYDRQGSPSDTWNYWLNVKHKTIWWGELYELDQAARVFPKKKDKAKVELAEGSYSQTGLDSILKGLEGRLVEFMGTAFASLNFTVEAKLESIDSRMSKMEERLTSIESKLSEEKNHGEDMDFRQWDHGNYGDYGTTAKDKGDKEEAGKSGEGEEEAEKSEGEGNKDKENSEADEENGSEQERVLNRMKDDELWRSLMEDREEVGGKVMEDKEEAETSEEVIENSQEEPMVEAEISEPRVAAEISEARVAAEISEPRVAAEISEPWVAAEISEARVVAEISEARVGSPIKEPHFESPIKEPHFESPIKEPHFESPIKEPRFEAHQTPTTPSGGRTKAMAARRVVNSLISTWAVVMEARKAVEPEEKTSEKIVEEETEEAEKVVEEETEEAEKVVEE